jgi:hypothetical protein
MTNEVESSDIVDYIDEMYDESLSGLSDPKLEHLPEGALFEAFAEKAIEKNPEYEISQLKARWNEETEDTGIPKQEFAVNVFNELISEEVRERMSTEDQESWISAVVQGLSEVKASTEN